MRAFLVLAALVCGCSSSEVEGATVQVGDLELVPPTDWIAKEYTPTTRVWTSPSHHETITVVIGPRFLGGAPQAVAETVRAQGLLPSAQVIATTPVTTANGFSGARVDLTFRPQSRAQVLQRNHVVLVDGDRTIHVIYTLDGHDTELSTLGSILSSLRKDG